MRPSTKVALAAISIAHEPDFLVSCEKCLLRYEAVPHQADFGIDLGLDNVPW